jgi:hypothetical protein
MLVCNGNLACLRTMSGGGIAAQYCLQQASVYIKCIQGRCWDTLCAVWSTNSAAVVSLLTAAGTATVACLVHKASTREVDGAAMFAPGQIPTRQGLAGGGRGGVLCSSQIAVPQQHTHDNPVLAVRDPATELH